MQEVEGVTLKDDVAEMKQTLETLQAEYAAEVVKRNMLLVEKNKILVEKNELVMQKNAEIDDLRTEVEFAKRKDEVIEMMKKGWDDVFVQSTTWRSSDEAVTNVRDVYNKVTRQCRRILDV